jgi:hypothetical protein
MLASQGIAWYELDESAQLSMRGIKSCLLTFAPETQHGGSRSSSEDEKLRRSSVYVSVSDIQGGFAVSCFL